MAANPNWPLVTTQVAFNSGFSTLQPLSWTDLTPRMWSMGCDRGRQYELDQNQAGTARLVLADRDEVLNPAHPNPGYPYAGNVLPYRPIAVQAQWPPVPVGAAVNLLNVSAQRPGPYDPSFESYTAGTSVPWIAAVGATTPVVGTATPRAGTKDLTWPTVATTMVQGVSWQVPCIPGQQYTSSAYVRQTAASTQLLQVTDQLTVLDAFGRTAGPGLGSAEIGGAWAVTSGAASEFAAANGVATITLATVAAERRINIGSGLTDVDLAGEYSPPVTAAGSFFTGGLLARYVDVNNYYWFVAFFNTDGTLSVSIFKRVAGALSTIATGTTGYTYVPGTYYQLRAQVVGGQLSCRVWPVSQVQPTSWHATVADASFSSGTVGLIAHADTANTSTLPIIVSVRNFSCVAAVAGSSSAATGAYNRLTVTWTATQPVHTIQLATTGSALAGTVLLDDVQHEPAVPLNANSNFESGVIGWSAGGAAIAASRFWVINGTLSAQITPNGVASFAYAEADQVAVTGNGSYVASGWVHSVSGTGSNVCGVRVNWYDASHAYLSTSAGTEYVLGPNSSGFYVNTFVAPASAAFAGVHAGIGGTPAAANVVYLDVVTLSSTTASAATTSGPVIYGVHRGFVERWPSNWDHQGMYGYSQITSVDGYAALAARRLHTEYRNVLLDKGPLYWYSLGEPAGATQFADGSGNGGTLLGIWTPNAVTTLPAAGTQTAIAGDPGSTGVKFTADLVNVNGQHGSVLINGRKAGTGYEPVGIPAVASSPWSATMALWLNSSTTFSSYGGGSWTPILALLKDDRAPRTYADLPLYITTTTSDEPMAFMQSASANSPSLQQLNVVATGFPVFDGKWHLVVATASQDATNSNIAIYVDGVFAGSNTALTSTIKLLGTACKNVELGGSFGDLGQNSGYDGTLAEFAVWNRALSASDITALWNAGQGLVGENSGARITRYLGYGKYGGATMVDTGLSTMGVSALADGTNLLAACQAVTTTENGNLVIDGAGTLTFTSRTRRYLNTSPQWLFGEMELPYQGDISFDYDPQQVYNDIKVNNAGGISASAVDLPSQISYGPRSLSRDVNVQSNNEASDTANWTLSTHKDPRQRIASITIEPSSNSALWPVALGAQIGDRVTVKRRTQAFTMQSDYFIERIAHSQAPNRWTVTFQLSPAGLWQTPWLLDDATYSVLGTSTILGY